MACLELLCVDILDFLCITPASCGWTGGDFLACLGGFPHSMRGIYHEQQNGKEELVYAEFTSGFPHHSPLPCVTLARCLHSQCFCSLVWNIL